MNVQDVQGRAVLKALSEQLNTQDPLEIIFWCQHELSRRYQDIEIRNGFHKPLIADLHNAHNQYSLKDMAWRVVEEMAEAMKAFEEKDKYATIHGWEEIADGLHFIVELVEMAGLDHTNCLPSRGEHDTFFFIMDADPSGLALKEDFADAVEELGWAMNCLKNKPWKTTHQLTDITEFYKRLRQAFCNYLWFARSSGLDAEGLVDLYLRKFTVNQFRQNSNY